MSQLLDAPPPGARADDRRVAANEFDSTNTVDSRRSRSRVGGTLLAAIWLLSAGLSTAWMAGGQSHAQVASDGTRQVLELNGLWRFQTGDDSDWARPAYRDDHWREVRLPTGFGRRDAVAEMAWYRREVVLPPSLSSHALGVTIGKVDSAYEIYVGGRLLGGVGALPPAPRPDYDRHAIYQLPPESIEDDGRIILALRVWKSAVTRSSVGGPHEGPLLIGPIGELTSRELRADMLPLFLSGWFLLLGLVHLELYRRRPEHDAFLWFACLAVGFALYGGLRTQWKYALTDNFVLLKEVEHGLLYILLAVFVQLIWPLIGLRIGPLLRTVQILDLTAGLVALLPGLRINILLLPYWQGLMIIVSVVGAFTVAREAMKRHPEARTVAIGAIGAAAAFVHDAAVDRGIITSPRLTSIGFAFLIACLILSLGRRYLRIEAEMEDLRNSEQAAGRANQAKSAFLANMSHEIRTPMTGILGAAELLAKDSDLQDSHRQKVQMIHSSARALLSIVDDVLDFSKVESAHFSIENVNFPLRETVSGALDLLEPRALAKGLSLDWSLDDSLPETVCGDPIRIRQVLLNLVGNAIKFTSEGGVRVHLQQPRNSQRPSHGLMLQCTVTDTGIGIAPEDQDSLFDPFTQVDSSTTRRFGGTGLGLAICERLVTIMGGEIHVDSEVGRGTTFTFTCRLRRAKKGKRIVSMMEPAGHDLPSALDLGDDSARGLRPQEQFSGREPSAAGAPFLMVAEDNPITRHLLEAQLEELGYRFHAVSDGAAALEALASQSFDLALMDCQMPEIDGYEATRRWRQQEVGGRHLPIIALTAHAMEGDRAKCLAAGMDDYLSKPFQQEELGAMIDRWLATGGSEGR